MRLEKLPKIFETLPRRTHLVVRHVLTKGDTFDLADTTYFFRYDFIVNRIDQLKFELGLQSMFIKQLFKNVKITLNIHLLKELRTCFHHYRAYNNYQKVSATAKVACNMHDQIPRIRTMIITDSYDFSQKVREKILGMKTRRELRVKLFRDTYETSVSINELRKNLANKSTDIFFVNPDLVYKHLFDLSSINNFIIPTISEDLEPLLECLRQAASNSLKRKRITLRFMSVRGDKQDNQLTSALSYALFKRCEEVGFEVSIHGGRSV